MAVLDVTVLTHPASLHARPEHLNLSRNMRGLREHARRLRQGLRLLSCFAELPRRRIATHDALGRSASLLTPVGRLHRLDHQALLRFCCRNHDSRSHRQSSCAASCWILQPRRCRLWLHHRHQVDRVDRQHLTFRRRRDHCASQQQRNNSRMPEQYRQHCDSARSVGEKVSKSRVSARRSGRQARYRPCTPEPPSGRALAWLRVHARRTCSATTVTSASCRALFPLRMQLFIAPAVTPARQPARPVRSAP
jgi:hypothetical protein